MKRVYDLLQQKDCSISRVYILILNWNGWKDTIECLESVFRLNYDNYRVIVCDNDSSDGSLEYIKAWADGSLDVFLDPSSALRIHSFPPIPKALKYRQYNRVEAEAGGCADDVDYPLILIETGGNLGFAGGNNVGLRYCLARDDFDHVWLLNNDTVVSQSALTDIISTMHHKPDTGICGSLLINYHQPSYIQAAGGAFDIRLARGTHILTGMPVTTPICDIELVDRLSYTVGASMLVNQSFLKTVGLLCEDYFLYFEEIDWAMRARGQYRLAIALNSHVYHKEGASIGQPRNNSPAFYLYQLNRLRFTSRFFCENVPIVALHILAHACKALLLGRTTMGFASLRAILFFVFSHTKGKVCVQQ